MSVDIGNDVDSGRDFIGRDSSRVVQYFGNKDTDNTDPDELANIIYLALFGDSRLRINGIIHDIDILRKEIENSGKERSKMSVEIDTLKKIQTTEINNRIKLFDDIDKIESILNRYTSIYERFDTKILNKLSSAYIYILGIIILLASILTIIEYTSRVIK